MIALSLYLLKWLSTKSLDNFVVLFILLLVFTRVCWSLILNIKRESGLLLSAAEWEYGHDLDDEL